MGTWERNPGGLLGFAQQISSTKVPWLRETVGVHTRLCVEVKPKSLWEWNGERRGSDKSPRTEVALWTPGSASCLWFQGFFFPFPCTKTSLQLVARSGLDAEEPACQLGAAELVHPGQKSLVDMLCLNFSHWWCYAMPQLCVWRRNNSSL